MSSTDLQWTSFSSVRAHRHPTLPSADFQISELPAGLVDENETPEQAAIRELEEETGYKSSNVLESSSVLASDPGMTTANMKLVTVDVLLDDKLEYPDQKLDEGEAIVKRVVELKSLYKELKGPCFRLGIAYPGTWLTCCIFTEYERKVGLTCMPCTYDILTRM